jgi:acetyl-CoA acetyltransferase
VIPSSGYEGIALVAPVTVPYQRYSDRKASYFIGTALHQMLQETGLQKIDIDGFAVSSFSLAPDGAVNLLEHFDLPVRWIEQTPFGGASGVITARRAARAIQSGDAEVVACIGGDTNPRGAFAKMVAQFSEFAASSAYPYGGAGPNGVFSLIADAYMKRYGATRESFGRIAVAQRKNAASFPLALLWEPLSMEGFLAARAIAEPLHLYDCLMPCAGAEGFLVMSVERARSLHLPYAKLLAADELHHAFASDPVQLRGGWLTYRDRMYDMAGIGPKDIGLLQTYNDYPVMSIIQMEDLGFCAKGEGWRFVEMHDLTNQGDFPHNSSGGQLSCGQAGAAGGYLGLVESIRQVTGRALGSQVPNLSHAMVSGYGMVSYDRGLCTAAAILSGGSI